MLGRREHKERSHQRNRLKVLSWKHPQIAQSPSGLFPGKKGLEGGWDTAKKAAACSVPGGPLWVHRGSHGDSQGDREAGVAGPLTNPSERCDEDIPGLCPWRAERRHMFKRLWCQDEVCRMRQAEQRKGVGQGQKTFTCKWGPSTQSCLRSQIPTPCKRVTSATEEWSCNHVICRNFKSLVWENQVWEVLWKA